MTVDLASIWCTRFLMDLMPSQGRLDGSSLSAIESPPTSMELPMANYPVSIWSFSKNIAVLSAVCIQRSVFRHFDFHLKISSQIYQSTSLSFYLLQNEGCET